VGSTTPARSDGGDRPQGDPKGEARLIYRVDKSIVCQGVA